MRFTIGLPITKIEYLSDTLDSITKQTFTDFELIIRNNASSHEIKSKIKETCSSWIEKQNVQYYESKEQLNISVNFNKILELATGEYFIILSDDDIIHPDFLKEFDKLINKYPNQDIYHCRVKLIDENNKLINYTEGCPDFESLSDFMFHRFESKRMLFLSDFVVSTEKLRKKGGFVIMPSGWGMDELTWCKLGINGFIFTNKVLLNYRMNRKNFSLSKNNLRMRFQDIMFCKKEFEQIINSSTFQMESIYPTDFILLKLELRINKIKNDVLLYYRQSSNFFEFISFYIKNASKYNLNFKPFLKLLIKKCL